MKIVLLLFLISSAISCKNRSSSSVADIKIEEDPKKSPLQIHSLMGDPRLNYCTLEYSLKETGCTIQFLINYTFSRDVETRILNQRTGPDDLDISTDALKTQIKEIKNCGYSVGKYEDISEIVVSCQKSSVQYLMGRYPIKNIDTAK